MIVSAIYIGAEGNYFVKGNGYNLELHQRWFGKIDVCPTHGQYHLPYADMWQTYNNLADLLRDWQLAGLFNQTYWHGGTPMQ